MLSLKQNLEDANLISDNNIDLAYKKFNHSLMKSLNLFTPLRNMIHKSKTNAPWFAKGLKNSFIKRNRLYKLWKSDKLNSLKKVEKFIRIAKKDHYYQKFNKCIRDSRQVFKVLNEINGKTAKSSKVSALLINNNKLSDPVLISNAFNDYFASVGTKLAS